MKNRWKQRGIAGGLMWVAFAAPGGASGSYAEAPELAALARAGRLDPVEARLPQTPLLVQPRERVGRYGGAWTIGILSLGDTDLLFRTIGYEGLVRWDPTWSRVAPNLAESFSMKPDGTEYTFRLRQGIRWSDGAPFTAADILAWHEAMYNPSGDRFLGPGLQVVRIDDFTVRFRFPRPNGFLLEYLATPQGQFPVLYPRHRLRECHPRFVADADQQAKAAGARSWQEWFDQVSDPYSWRRFFRGWPVLGAWVMTQPLPDGFDGAAQPGQSFVAERNPYYWKIDPAGQQLPYLDRVRFLVASNAQQVVRWAAEGRLEMQYFYLSGEEHRAELERAAAAGGYRLFERSLSVSSAAAISLNLTHKDPALRSLLAQRQFRVGLSLALDRRRMIREIGLGLGEPYQVAPRPESLLYSERLAHQHTDYRPEEARRLLDACGCARRDEAGFRLRPDGRRLRLELALCENPYYGEQWRRVASAVARDWSAAGVETTVAVLDRQALYAKKNNNDHDAVIWEGEGGTDPLLETRYYLPTSWESNYAVPWYYWWAGDRVRGEEPPESVKAQLASYEALLRETTTPGRHARMRGILDEAAEQFYTLGIALQRPGFGVVARRCRNVPIAMPSAWSYPSPAPVNPCQFFLEGPGEGAP